MKFFFVLCLLNIIQRIFSCDYRTDLSLSTEDFILKNGYPVETHEIVTKDGYILTIFRIPHGNSTNETNKKPILLTHGLTGQGEHFLINCEESLAYYSANIGYDVWLVSFRGTNHGRKHKYLTTNEKEFWNFSHHEIGVIDLPAVIDYILEITNKSKVSFIGHSQGGAVLYITCSVLPEYQEKIKFASLLAPAGFENHFSSTLWRSLARAYRELEKFSEFIHLYEIPPSNLFEFKTLSNLCSDERFKNFCVKFLDRLLENDGRINKRMYPMILKYASSVSSKQLLHFAQTITSGHFRPYDYGLSKNMKLYGKSVPDDYPVEQIKIPIAVYYSFQDRLATAKDIEHMCDVLGNCVGKFPIPDDKFSHYHFVFSKNLVNFLYKQVLERARKYEDE